MWLPIVFLICTCTSWALGLTASERTAIEVGTLAKNGGLKYDNLKQVEAFRTFIIQNGITYAGEEEIKMRFELFKKSGKKYGYGTDWTSDRTKAEILARTGLVITEEVAKKMKEKMKADRKIVEQLTQDVKLPETFDWRNQSKYLTPIGHQGECGSCWAFAFAATLESAHAIRFKKTAVPLSKSELVECAKGAKGCDGGDFMPAMDYSKKNGLLTEAAYPYRNGENHTWPCESATIMSTRITPDVAIAADNIDSMMKFIVKYGPIFVAYNAKTTPGDRSTTIVREDRKNCCPHILGAQCPDKENKNHINHAVVIVGYGEAEVPYWIVKNSWGTTSGEDGYFRIERGTNACGIEELGGWAIGWKEFFGIR